MALAVALQRSSQALYCRRFEDYLCECGVLLLVGHSARVLVFRTCSNVKTTTLPSA